MYGHVAPCVVLLTSPRSVGLARARSASACHYVRTVPPSERALMQFRALCWRVAAAVDAPPVAAHRIPAASFRLVVECLVCSWSSPRVLVVECLVCSWSSASCASGRVPRVLVVESSCARGRVPRVLVVECLVCSWSSASCARGRVLVC